MLPILRYVYENGVDTRLVVHHLNGKYTDIISSADMEMLVYIHETIGISFAGHPFVHIDVTSPHDFELYDESAWEPHRKTFHDAYARLDYLIQHGVTYRDPMGYYVPNNIPL
jgi:hypothetical protein